MNDNMLLGVATVVFSLVLIGVVLTILEFRRGEPREQQKEARK